MFLEMEKTNVDIPLVVLFMTPYSLGRLPVFWGNLTFSISSSSHFKKEATNILQTLVTTYDLTGVITQKTTI